MGAIRIGNLIRLGALAFLCAAAAAHAEEARVAQAAQAPLELNGAWLQAPADWQYAPEAGLHDSALKPVEHVSLTGGRYFHEAEFDLARAETMVVDFKNTSIIGNFHLWLYDAQGRLLGDAQGGIRDGTPNPFFLSHGRTFNLAAGHYRLVTELDSPFYLAEPRPYAVALASYQQAIKPGSVLTLACLGIFVGLGLYYVVLGILRRRPAEGMYALFILGNLLFQGASLLVNSDVLGLHAMALVGAPLLFSNMAYVGFVYALLDIRRETHPRLHRAALVALALLGLLAATAAFAPNWALELERYGVMVFLTFGLAAGIVRSMEGEYVARYYVAAVSVFFLLGATAVFLTDMKTAYLVRIEHVGLVAVTVEALLLAFVLSYQFVSLRHEKEAALQEKARSDEANFAKSRFLANMSHEIRTPMNAIIGFSEIALRSELSPTLRDYLTKILSSSEALLAILNDILDYSKVEAGRMEIEPVEFRLEALVEKVANLFSALAAEKELELVFEIGASVPDVVIGDPVRLGQVLNNLVGNAVKFTAEGTVHVRLVQIAEESGCSVLNIRVSDTGIGMNPAQVASLFRPFTQADSSITRRFGGTGLGLAISSRLVALMGGEIMVQSEEDAGSIFTFTLRLPVSRKEEASRIPDLGVSRVLIVDDVEISRRILVETCKAWGLEAVEADSGFRALEELRSASSVGRPFDLVLLDWKMPEMDGLDLTRIIRDDVQSRRIDKLPVVIMTTAFSREQLLKEASGVTLDAILIKPVMPSALLETILNVQHGGDAREAAMAAPRRWEMAPPSLRGAHILLVEDNEINQFVAREFLGHTGAHVSVADNGREAVTAVLDGNFDAVLMDVHMPMMDGLEATRLIRQDGRFEKLPIIAMTGAVTTEDRNACYEAGMNDHLPKPVLPKDLLNMLNKWVKPKRGGEAKEGAGGAEGEARGASPQLSGLPGFDFSQVLMMLRGNEAQLKSLLRQFAEEYGDAGARLETCLREDDRPGAAALAHKIKGVAGNLGAYALSQAAGELEAQLASGAPVGEAAEFFSAMTLALQGISGLKDDVPKAAAPKAAAGHAEQCERCDRGAAAGLLRQLRGYLENNEIMPHELVAELMESLPCAPISQRLVRVEKFVGRLDYRNARAALDELHCKHGHPLEAE